MSQKSIQKHESQKDFLAGLARGATRSALTAELAEAARSGEVSGVLQALGFEFRAL